MLFFFLILHAGAIREQDTSLVLLSPAGEGSRSFGPEERPLDRFTLSMKVRLIHVRGLPPELCNELPRDASLVFRRYRPRSLV